MRIKWNRHLDGSSSRREDEETAGTQEADDNKKRGAAATSSTPGIFKIFRRKKHRRDEDKSKTDGNNSLVPPLPPLNSEAVEDDSASISSVATCASQPVTEPGFQRDRSSSLFSSFRLSLPGSKRKKRKIAPAPSETLFNGQQQQSQPQVDRYSTPDLRKPPDKLETHDAAQVNLSISSPSVRCNNNPRGVPSTSSAQSLDVRNAESLDKLKWSSSSNSASKSALASPAGSKLSKSVSFSDCCKNDGLIDSSPHSTRDNKVPRAVNCTAMVEEDCGALESEPTSCLSDNLRMSRESKFTAVGDDSLSSAANVPSLQKQSAVDALAAVMTKTEEAVVTVRNSKQSAIAEIGDILSDITTEIQCYGKRNKEENICSVKESSEVDLGASTINYDSLGIRDVYNCEAVNADDEHISQKNKTYEVHVDKNKSPIVQCIETVSDVSPHVPERNLKFNNSYENPPVPPCHEKDTNSTTEKCLTDKLKNVSLNSKLEVLTSELSVLTAAKNVSKLNCDTAADDVNFGVDKDLCTKKYECEMSAETPEKHSVITSDKHVVCHMTVYGSEISVQKSDHSEVISDAPIHFENSADKNSPQISFVDSSASQKDTSLLVNGEYESELADSEILISKPTSESNFDSQNHSSPSEYDPVFYDSNASNSLSENVINCDQKVPESDDMQNAYENHAFQNDQQVPEFELSLMEFEEVCSKYMSRSNPEFLDCNYTIPLYNNSLKRKSVLDLSYSFIYPNFKEDNGSPMYFRKKVNGSPSPSDLIRQNIKVNGHHQLQSSCQNLTDKQSLLPSPPKQWKDDLEKSINIQSSHRNDVCTDGVQCTNKARGKNLCQNPCPGALPTTVMLDDSDLRGIDTPQLSSTLPAFETKSGRDEEEYISIITGEKQQSSDVQSFSEEMISNVSPTISNLNGVLDFSYVSESSCKSSSVFFDSEIRDTYRGPRAICDPLIYSAEVAKGLESLVPENYLNGHNFPDIKNVGFCEVISDASCDYVPAGNGLIEISNPYEDTFILPQDLSKQNLVKGVSASLPNGRLSENLNLATIFDKVETSKVPKSHNSTVKEKSSKAENISKSSSFSDVSEICNTATDKLIPNASDHIKESKPTPVEQKNFKNKNSMIPCRKRVTPNAENTNNKKIETKSKAKKSNSLPRFNKTESHLPVKNNSSHRVFHNSYKDSGVEQQSSQGKQKDLSFVNYSNANNKPNGNCIGISSPVTINSETSNSQHGNLVPFDDSGCYETDEKNSSSLLESSACYSSEVVINLEENCHSKSLNESSTLHRNEPDDSKSVLSTTSTDNIPSILEFDAQESKVNITSFKFLEISDNISDCAVSVSENNDASGTFSEGICPECLHMGLENHIDIPVENVKHQYCSKHSDYAQQYSRRSSLSAVSGMRKTSYTSSKESLTSQLTTSSNRGKSRIPRILSKIKRSVSGTFTTKRNSNSEQPGTRGAQPSSKGPVRPPMWLSKAELTQEIQRLGTLCEARTKELNRLKMETKHVSVGFDAFAALFKYMVEDLNGLSVPALTEDLGKTLKQLELTKQDLAYYEREVEEMKSHHCQELNDLSNKLFEVYQSEVAELNAKHQEEINDLKSDHQKQIEHLTATYDASSSEAKAHHKKLIANLEQEIINQREELQQLQEREIRDVEERHAESSKLLQEHIEQLQKKCAELKQHSMSMEDAMRKDTDSKLQWVTAAKLDLEKEVESLKAVLEMKNKELHTLRVQNLEMEKQLEELPFAREKIKMLQARAEDLEALMVEKTKLERKLSTENQQMKETYEKESKVNRRLSMENEELQWRLRQAENSLISGSFSEVPEFPEAEESTAVASPTKSPGPQMLSRSVFFTFVDKDDGIPHSPRSQYKKISPNFSANYKTSPAKSSKSPPAPSPRRGKSHSEPPQPITFTSTPRKVAKTPLGKTKCPQKRQRSGSDSTRPNEHMEVNFSSVTESMASSVSSESSVFEHRERLLDEHKEHIIHSLEILREQRSTESNVDEPTVMEKKWCSDDIKITGELSNLETEDMSRSAEFSDPKTYYHMTFPVLKESGIPDCDIEDGCKNSSSGSSPMKEVNSMHSMSENNIHSAVEASDTLQVMSMSSQEVSTTTVLRIESKQNGCAESSLSAENVQKATSDDKAENRWRTI